MITLNLMAALNRMGVGWSLLSVTVVFCTCSKAYQRRTTLVQTNKSICRSMVVLMLMVVSALVEFSYASPRRSSALSSDESSSLSLHPLIVGMSERILNPNLSFSSTKDLVSCVQKAPVK